MTDSRTLAEHYVLGMLSATDRAAVEARIVRPSTDPDRALATDVRTVLRHWQEVDLKTPEAAVPEGLWDRITQAVASAGTAPDEVASATLVPLSRTAAVDPSARTVRVWRAVAGLAVAACLALAALLLTSVLTPQPVVMAILLDDDGTSVAVIEAFEDDSVRVTPLAPVSATGAEVLQVWTKPDPDGPPVSLGILQRAMRERLAGPDLPLPAEDQLFEITLEPPGGSPTGLPTGPILGKGLAQRAF